MSHLILQASQLSHLLRSTRAARKLSQAALAERLGISQNRVSELESDPAQLTAERLLDWLAILKLELWVAPQGANPPDQPQGQAGTPVEW
ncbi:hypothetical protein GCM10023144_05600 [Pigmentiphaga soli]|uniref:HTH cro/C1-type domain-containing protein n=1 Tax=Pigmentiphaga soli TaxID=1007095 RepID=A0ABP8GH78_9BURK